MSKSKRASAHHTNAHAAAVRRQELRRSNAAGTHTDRRRPARSVAKQQLRQELR